jgi:ABC-type protease/lipase transport system fused ATPase/permease subunit
MLRQVRRAIGAAFLLGGCAHVLFLAVPLYAMAVLELGLGASGTDALLLYSVLALTAVVAALLADWSRRAILVRAGLWLEHELGRHTLENAIRVGRAGGELHRDMRSIGRFGGSLASGVAATALDVPWTVLSVMAAGLVHPFFGAIALAAMLLLLSAALIEAGPAKASLQKIRHARDGSERWRQSIADRLQLVPALGLAEGASAHWELLNRPSVAASWTHGKRGARRHAFSSLVVLGTCLAVPAAGAWLVMHGEAQVAAVAAAFLLTERILSVLTFVAAEAGTLRTAWAGYRRLMALPQDAVRPRGLDRAIAGGHQLILHEVAFGLEGCPRPVLDGVSLSLRPGELVAITGANGSGKSVLTALIAGALDPASGTVEIDGIPVARRQRSGEPSPVGYLPEEPLLFEGTVSDNICGFREAPREAVEAAALRAGVYEIIERLPQGFATRVDATGCPLSRLERRSIALARALFGTPQIVVLDAPELGLDEIACERLMQMMIELRNEGVSLVLATMSNRLLRMADTIGVLDGGRLHLERQSGRGAISTGACRLDQRPPRAA